MKKKNSEKKRKRSGLMWFLGVSALSITLLLCCQFFFADAITGKEKFFENTKINGIDVGGMSVAQAENVVLTQMLENKKDIEINLSHKDKEWTLKGKDFEISNKIQPKIDEISKFGRDGNFFQNLKKSNDIKKNGKDFRISYSNILSNLDEKIDEIVSSVEQQAKPASLVFNPENDEPFSIDMGQPCIVVNREELYNLIDTNLSLTNHIKIEIPTIEITEEIDAEKLKNSVEKRSEFSTSIEKSSSSRKNNVTKAISAFNGMIVMPDETVSFNETTGKRSEENGYKNAHIIVGGVYVDGVGGGVCQASTTLYNALLLADVQVLTANHHSLPASYVPLSFDAMVSGDYSDLVFKNNLQTPIYIKTSSDEKTIKVEIYGQPLEEGVEIKRRAELVKVLGHNGDRIVSDTNGDYSNKILYKGEYYRVKYPHEGYESKGYLQYYKNGNLVEEKEIRHDFYSASEGIVMEGVETPEQNMKIPPSDVKIISPQKVTKQTEENVRNKLVKTFPSELNP